MWLSVKMMGPVKKKYCQIELLFKAIKQNLKIKMFVGTSENTLYIQIWTALISILLLKYMQFRSRINWSFSNLVALLRWNFFNHPERPFIDFRISVKPSVRYTQTQNNENIVLPSLL